MGVWVVVEAGEGTVSEPGLEALGEAVELARPERPAVLAVGQPADEGALARLAAHGAGRVVLLDRGPRAPGPEADGAAVAAWLRSAETAPAILLGHTRYGRAVAARLAVGLDAALAPDAIAARRVPGGGLVVTRPAYGERLYASVRIPAGVPAVVTLRPGALGVGPSRPEPDARVERHPARTLADVRAPRSRGIRAADPRTVDLRDAERIVAGGRGVGGPEGFGLVAELADSLGAAVGGSRVAVDLGWLPWERQIGQSGRAVAPRLYVALGISGASQHLAGIRAAQTIVAINADRAAPILDVAHLAVVADWRPVVVVLLERLRARHATAP
ncbi:MAG: electron transfer flavoprotein subunit alpha/FixB family protein [Candidatus Rokubacteria bacterium]|nr:electron transfer flavoprotein subunit alpha/FixB family protein [Candidatus Rokubacteria bacterium]